MMNSGIIQIQEKIYYWLFMALAFFIPVYDKAAALIIGLLLLNWILEGRFRKRFLAVRKDGLRKKIFLFSTLYFAYVLGMIYSKNLDYGLLDLETKLSILIFPLIFSTLSFEVLKGKMKHFLFAFLAGSLATTFILLFHSYLNYSESQSTSEFFYGGLSWYHHASYIAMFLDFRWG
ncbi:MAG: hypothetical protein R2764_20665 [Bacteroidales bacterium]